jgi:hypothetical protein
MLNYSIDINGDIYPVILKSIIKFLFFNDMLTQYYNGLKKLK